ncbi:MAG: hypothetical protein A2Z17_03380 [Gammaproteobacteria bacterium RBG_16_66_13]|nr:MAG: hypothetical protein A2Z17_03380 [Gammaproteobacteria bacterium RBG_16_66_13]
MNAIRQLLERRGVLTGAAVVLGLVLGLVYAWGIQPVKWVDATPELLRTDLRTDYLKMAIDSYSVNRDVDLAISRFEALGDYAGETLRAIESIPGEVNPTAIQNYRSVVQIFEPGAAATASPTQTARPPSPVSVSRLILPVCGVTLVLALALGAALFLRSRGSRVGRARAVEAEGEEPSEPGGVAAPGGARAPLATFRTTYSLGDDLYDDSFSIESPAGDFLGECGVGVGDTIGVGEPKKVSAFEVWLFDKNDIQTVTKVLMSGYTYQDEPTRQRIAAKGDPVVAENGAIVSLETASLKVEARIVDMTYGEGVLPAESHFARMTIELRALAKGVDE